MDLWLVVRRREAAGSATPLRGERFVLGSSGECDLVLVGNRISRRHAEVARTGEGFTLRDLGSSLGTFMGGRRIDQVPLRPGDVFSIDDLTVEVLDRVPARGPAPSPTLPAGTTARPSADVDWRPLSAFVEGLVGASEPHQVLERLLAGLVALVGAERGFVLHAAEPGGALARVASHGLPDAAECEDLSTTVCATTLEGRTVVAIADSLRDERCRGAASLAVSTRPRSILCAPMLLADRAVGVIYLDRPLAAGWSPEFLPLVQSTVGLAAELLGAQRTRQRLTAARGTIAALRRLQEPEEPLVVGSGPAGVELGQLIDAAAAQDVTALITGETGTGKEMVARELHARSRRRAGPFIAVNCAALPQDLAAAELFGAERGAFTGATEQRVGRFELAEGGTLFLDEVGELSPELQVTLLRVLQERRITRLGSRESLAVDFRLVAATNADVEDLVRTGRLRQDFYYRINVFRIPLRPLRERAEDVLVLARHFLAHFCRRHRRNLQGFTPEAERALSRARWLGNVRELRNAVERAVVVERGELVQADSLPVAVPSPAAAGDGGPPDAELPLLYEAARDDFDRRFLRRALLRHHNNLRAVAREAGISRTTLYKRLEQLGLHVGA